MIGSTKKTNTKKILIKFTHHAHETQHYSARINSAIDPFVKTFSLLDSPKFSVMPAISISPFSRLIFLEIDVRKITVDALPAQINFAENLENVLQNEKTEKQNEIRFYLIENAKKLRGRKGEKKEPTGTN